AVRATGSTASTRSSPPGSSTGPVAAGRNRNRLEVRLPSRTGAPGGNAAYCRRSAATARACSARSTSTLVRYRRDGGGSLISARPAAAIRSSGRSGPVPAGTVGPMAADVSRAQVLGFRVRSQQLDRPPGERATLAGTAALDLGVQDTGADRAWWALAVRGVTAS